MTNLDTPNAQHFSDAAGSDRGAAGSMWQARICTKPSGQLCFIIITDGGLKVLPTCKPFGKHLVDTHPTTGLDASNSDSQLSLSLVGYQRGAPAALAKNL